MILALNGEGPWDCRICNGRKRVHAPKEGKIKNDIQMKIKTGSATQSHKSRQELLGMGKCSQDAGTRRLHGQIE